MINIIINIIMVILAFIAFYVLYNLFLGDIEGRVNKALDEHELGHAEEKEINMTAGKMNKINEWMTHLDQQTMDLSDQLAVTQATMEYLAKLEPIYDKYTGSGKEKRYR